jgi:hypothetical protein
MERSGDAWVPVSGHGGFLTRMVSTEKLWRGREKA